MKYKAPFCVGTMGAGQLRQPVLMAAAAGKPYNRSSSVGRFIGRSFCVQAKDKIRPTWRPSAGSPQQKCTLLVPAAASPPEVEILAALCLVVLMGVLLPCGLLCPRTAGERWCRRHQRGKSHREVASSRRLVFITVCLKCGMYRDSSLALRMTRTAGRVSIEQTSPSGMHSEHILKERSDAQNVVSRFSTGKHVTGFSGRVAPYESSSFATPQAGEQYMGGENLCTRRGHSREAASS